jgi:hypothetical protein
MVGLLTIAIDFDDTFTADAEAWTAVIQTLRSFGHRVVCVSARRNTFEHRAELVNALPSGVTVLLSYDTPKRLYAKEQGVEVDIWIDDMPEAIPTRADMERVC